MKFLYDLKKRFTHIFNQNILENKLLWGILFFVFISLILTIDLFPNQVDIKPGEVSKTDITAPRTITFTDEERTQELREIAGDSARKVYEEDEQIGEEIKKDIQNLFNYVKSIDPETQDISEIDEEIQEKFNIKFEEEVIDILVSTNEEKLEEMQSRAMAIMDNQLDKRILPGELSETREDLENQIQNLNINQEKKKVLVSILVKFVRPNMFLNEEATEENREQAIRDVESYEHTVRQGEIIVRKGDVVTVEDIKVLENLGLLKTRIDYFNIAGIILIVLTLIILVALYLRKYKNELWNDNKKLLLLESLVILIAILGKIINIFQSPYLFYLVPIAVASVLVTVLLNKDIAFILTIFLTFLVALIFENSFNVALIGFVSGIVGIFSVSDVTQRSDLIRAGFYVSGVLLLTITGLTFTSSFNNWQDLLQPGLMGLINGVLVAVLANGLLPYIENIFGLTSSVKLLELANPSHPLLKRLLVEAPGTYHHSIIVGNLAETAADNIGANSLLTRVAAYYHDIGKLKRPYFFTDNQFGGDNPHENISANLSSLIIKNHVKDGVELAKKFKLPEPIINIMEQHHGTNLISYFYRQAMEEESKDIIKETDFSYDGPKPQTKEAAIIMLADIVEAAVRSKNFDKSDHNRIEMTVRDLIKDRLIKNQLDESALTLKELDIIGESFVRVLTGIYHQRIEYPDKLINESKKDDQNGESADQQ
ncbi:MAG: HD family phosphohydrolase [Bacillota bacterium]